MHGHKLVGQSEETNSMHWGGGIFQMKQQSHHQLW
jgi:hypothetical protein